MPVTKERLHILDLLNLAVGEQRKLEETKLDMLVRPATIWYMQNYNDDDDDNSSSLPLAKRPLMQRLYIYCILVSRICEKISASMPMKLMRAVAWLVLFVCLVYATPLIGLPYSRSPAPGKMITIGLYSVSLAVNIWFVLDSLLKMCGFLIRIKVENAFNREVTNAQVISGLGIVDMLVSIIVLSFGLSEVGLWFQVVQLFVKTQAIIKLFPHIGILLSGVVSGLKSVVYTIACLFLLVMSYAVLCHKLFAKNDPFHFGTLAMSAITMFRLSTFEGWGSAMFLNSYGCDGYPSEYSSILPVVNQTSGFLVETGYGSFRTPFCSHPQAQPTASSIIFCSYAVLAGYVIVGMCLAAVAIGINERLEELRTLTLYTLEDQGGNDAQGGDATPSSAANSSQDEAKKRKQMFDGKAAKLTGGNVAGKKIKQHLTHVWEMLRKEGKGGSKHKFFNDVGSGGGGRKQKLTFSTLTWSRLSEEAHQLVNTPHYKSCFVVIILAAAILQLTDETTPDVVDGSTWAAAIFFQIFFLIDSGVRFVSHCGGNPISFFRDGWNCFDLIITVVLFVPDSMPADSQVQFLVFLRMLRMARILEIGGNYATDLNVILNAGYYSFICLLYVMAIVLLLFSYFAFIGILLFKEANPFHFGNLGTALMVLLEVMTMDNWGDAMNCGMLGCRAYPYDPTIVSTGPGCQYSGSGVGYLSPIFFVSFVIISGYVLTNLLVGVIITSMELLREGIIEEEEVWEKVEDVRKRYNVGKSAVDSMLELFEDADKVKKVGVLTYEDLEPMVCQMGVDEAEVFAFYVKVDLDKNGQLDFSEFCELILMMGLSYAQKKDNEEREKKEAGKRKKLTVPDDPKSTHSTSHKNSSSGKIVAQPDASSRRSIPRALFGLSKISSRISLTETSTKTTTASSEANLTTESYDHTTTLVEAKDDGTSSSKEKDKPRSSPRMFSFDFFNRISPSHDNLSNYDDIDHDGFYQHGV